MVGVEQPQQLSSSGRLEQCTAACLALLEGALCNPACPKCWTLMFGPAGVRRLIEEEGWYSTTANLCPSAVLGRLQGHQCHLPADTMAANDVWQMGCVFWQLLMRGEFVFCPKRVQAADILSTVGEEHTKLVSSSCRTCLVSSRLALVCDRCLLTCCMTVSDHATAALLLCRRCTRGMTARSGLAGRGCQRATARAPTSRSCGRCCSSSGKSTAPSAQQHKPCWSVLS